MDTTESKMCPTCNVAMENGACPQCGAKAEGSEETSAPAAEETTDTAPQA